MGLHRIYASMIERGEQSMTVITLVALGVRPGDLLDALPEALPKDTE